MPRTVRCLCRRRRASAECRVSVRRLAPIPGARRGHASRHLHPFSLLPLEVPLLRLRLARRGGDPAGTVHRGGPARASRPRRAVRRTFARGRVDLFRRRNAVVVGPFASRPRARRLPRSLRRARGAEITLEANPGTTDEGRFTAFRKLGVNRLSIGVQSFADSQLLVLGRKHSGSEAERAFRTARAAGFDNVSLDLIHGGSGHTVQAAARDAASAVALGPEHISAYALTLTGLAEDVPMAKAVRRGEVVLPSDDEQAAMGEAVRSELARGGYARYEISNFARPGFEAVHNSLYWRGVEYVAAGCGACGFLRRRHGAILARRYMNDRSPERYLERVEETGLGEASFEEVDREQHLRERIFTGLRLSEGIDLRVLEEDLGSAILSRFARVIDRLVREELVVLQGTHLRLTDRGLDLHSEVAVRFF